MQPGMEFKHDSVSGLEGFYSFMHSGFKHVFQIHYLTDIILGAKDINMKNILFLTLRNLSPHRVKEHNQHK